MRKSKSKSNYKIIATIMTLVVALGVVGVVGVSKAQQESGVSDLTELAKALGGNVEAFMAGLSYLKGGATEAVSDVLGAAGVPNRLPHGYWDTAYGYYVDAVKIIDEYGYKTMEPLAQDLTMSAASTSTPGSLVSLYNNTGANLICGVAELNITTAPDGGRFTFGLATSTSAVTITGAGNGIMASTTVATGTAILLNSIDNVGGNTIDRWIWTAGTYIVGTWDAETKSASTTDYDTAAGKIYVDCHSL